MAADILPESTKTLRDQGLEVEVVDGRLVISIGIDALMVAVRASPVWEEADADDRGWVIDSADGFAADIATELRHEKDDGTTPVHEMLDAATEAAIDAGSLNIDLGVDG